MQNYGQVQFFLLKRDLISLHNTFNAALHPSTSVKIMITYTDKYSYTLLVVLSASEVGLMMNW